MRRPASARPRLATRPNPRRRVDRRAQQAHRGVYRARRSARAAGLRHGGSARGEDSAMIALATLAETKAALRIDDGDLISDAGIDLLISVASESVVAYLKRRVIEVITDPDVSPATTEVQMDLEASPPLIPARV